jgi:hypothetical protein
VLLGNIAAFADGFGNFDSFSEADADAAMLVARDNERGETKAAAAFDDFGGAVDENDFFAQFGRAANDVRIAALSGRWTRPPRTTARAASATTATS